MISKNVYFKVEYDFKHEDIPIEGQNNFNFEKYVQECILKTLDIKLNCYENKISTINIETPCVSLKQTKGKTYICTKKMRYKEIFNEKMLLQVINSLRSDKLESFNKCYETPDFNIKRYIIKNKQIIFDVNNNMLITIIR